MRLLSNLPAELIEDIIQVFCLGCTANPLAEDERYCYFGNCRCPAYRSAPYHSSRVSALASLCLTSRQLNSAATRHLYHRPLGNKWWLLARTLLARKDLGQMVRDFPEKNYDMDGAELNCPPEVGTYFAEYYQAYVDSLPENSFLMESALETLNDVPFRRGENFPLDIITSLCPNLETLSTDVDYFNVFRFCPPQSLVRLRSVTLAHADTEFGMDIGYSVHLFRAAPNIDNLTLYAAARCPDLNLTLDKLTNLNLQPGAFSSNSLHHILAACPNLERFNYEMGYDNVGYEQFTLLEAWDAFLAHTPKLKVVRLDRGEVDYDEIWNEDDAESLRRVMEDRGIQFELCW
ncbi:hypothetical protein C8A00DRAFT_45398 [Chaetomidium leptoderma]|uniref:F-box domain-containing protein n=1 Tax=Chaetomidium leptoderma TaxID=669021 RepID=A0AAN6VH16_9PEZI|nr:hypothetical protein C8A00DRAFT_45398 [Chaetomidium leptoderma]